jgi:hypothetical protein
MRRVTSVALALAGAIATVLVGSCSDNPVEPAGSTAGPAAHMPIAFATASTVSGAVFTTDKDDYVPGDTLKLAGWGWQAGDTLDIHLDLNPQNHPPVDWAVGVDANGDFQDSTYVVQESDLGVTFALTATSRATGDTATAVFYDHSFAGAFINKVNGATATPVTVHSNSSFTIRAGASETTTGNSTHPVWTGTSYGFNTTNSAPASGSFVCLSPAKPTAPGVTITATASPGTDAGEDMTIPATGLARGTQWVFIRAHGATDCSAPGGISSPSVGWQLTVQGPDLALTKSHIAADFVRGANADYTIKVQNVGEDATSGTITVVDNGLPNNMTAVAISGLNWTCTLATLTCTRSSSLASLAFADDITLTVAVGKAGNATVTNTATVSGGGDNTTGNNTANDATTLIDAPATHLTITSAAITAAINTCSSAITVQTRNQFNQPVRPDANVQVDLSSTSGGGTFYAAAGCGGSPVTSITIPSTDFSVNFYYKDSSCGTPTIKTKDNNSGAGSLGEDTQQETINGCAANTAPTVDAGGPYTVDEGTQLALSPTVTDPDAGDVLTYKWSIVYTTPIDAGGSCSFDDDTKKLAKITCDDDSNGGTFTLSLEVKDGAGGHTVSDNATLTVNNANPTANAGTSYSGNEGSAIALNGSGDDPGNNDDAQLTYKWSINTSGIDAVGGCSFDDDTKKDAKVTCTDDSNGGTFDLSLVVKDDDNGTSAASHATLSVANVDPTADAGGPYSGNEGSAIQLSGSGNDAGSNDVAGLTYKWTVNTSGIDAGGACTFDDDTKKDAKVTCTDDSGAGTFTLSLVVKDDDNGTSAASTANLTVSNVAPTMSITAPGDYSVWAITAPEFGSAGFVTASLSDVGKNDTHTCKINWGDGDPEVNGVVTETLGSGTGSCASAGGNPYTDDGAGIYLITVTVADDDGGQVSASRTIIVYDPSAGFVTGGGWFNSPAGAYLADASLTGKANFGFVSKYLKGNNVPSGNTEFQFQAGNLNFHSDIYEWLVVNQNGVNAQFKGNGLINGQGCAADREGKCRFMLWAFDGTKNGGYDTFRIEIWTEDSGGTKHDLYDNGGSGSGGFSTAAIGGGSIQVQTGKK